MQVVGRRSEKRHASIPIGSAWSRTRTLTCIFTHCHILDEPRAPAELSVVQIDVCADALCAVNVHEGAGPLISDGRETLYLQNTS